MSCLEIPGWSLERQSNSSSSPYDPERTDSAGLIPLVIHQRGAERSIMICCCFPAWEENHRSKLTALITGFWFDSPAGGVFLYSLYCGISSRTTEKDHEDQG